MVSISKSVGKGGSRQKRTPGPFKGVRMRKWGRWVSEIRIPNSPTRIWLGSYDAPEKAARAYDAALYCLRGIRGRFNFPAEKRPELPGGYPTTLSKAEIKAIAARFASPGCASASISSTTLPSPDVPASMEFGDIFEIGEMLALPNLPVFNTFWPECFSEDPIVTMDTAWAPDFIKLIN